MIASGGELLAKIKTDLKSTFFRNFVVLMSGTALAQIITVSFAPVLSRLYDPANFGVLGLYLSTVGIIGVVATLRYEQAMMLPKKVEDSANLFGLSFLCLSVVTALAALICVPFGARIAALANAPTLGPWMWLMPISIFLYAAYQVLNTWSTRQKQFQRASISLVVRSATVTSVQTTAGVCKAGAMGLVGGDIAGNVCATLALGAQVFKSDRKILTQAFDLGRMKQLGKEYVDFPLYSNTQVLLNTVSQNLPIFFLTYFFNEKIAGLYFMSVRILQMPMNLVLVSLRQVFFQKASEVYSAGGDTYALFKKVTLGLSSMAFGPALLIVLFAPLLFSFVLGEKWYESGEYARWLIMWLAVAFMNVPSAIFGQVCRRQRNLLIQEVAFLICRIGALVIGGLYLDAYHTVVIYSIVGIVFNTYLIMWMWMVLKRQSIQQSATSISESSR